MQKPTAIFPRCLNQSVGIEEASSNRLSAGIGIYFCPSALSAGSSATATEVSLNKQPRPQPTDQKPFPRFRNLCYANRILNGW